MEPIQGSYDYGLVTLSLAIVIATSHTTLDLAERVSANRGRSRFAWLAGGACAMGSGIWCMHYTGMLAFKLPIPVYYDVPTVVFSLLAAVLASLIALLIVSRASPTGRQVISGSVLMGTGIATMHYSGMAAMRLRAMHHYDRRMLILSILLAIIISFTGIKTLYLYPNRRHWKPLKAVVAIVLGIAIASMHYTGMLAVSFSSMDAAPDLTYAVDITGLTIFAIVLVTILILGFAVVAIVIDRHMFTQKNKLDEERAILRALIDNIPDYMYVKDLQSRFVIANPHLAREVGADNPEKLVGKSDHDFYPKHLADEFLADEEKVLLSGEPLYNREEKGISRSGHNIDVLTTKVPIRDSNGQVTGIAGIGRDISNLKLMECALRDAELRWRSIFESAIFGIFQSSPSGALINVNASMAHTFSYDSPEEMIAAVTDIGRQLFTDSKRGVDFMQVMDRTGSVRSFECEMFCKDRKKIWINMSACAIRHNGDVIRYEGMCDDVTERNALREQLSQAQKLESVGQLAAGIAHEINTPIQYVGDNVRFLEDSFAALLDLLKGYGALMEAARQGVPVPDPLIDSIDQAVERTDAVYLEEEVPKAIQQSLDGVGRIATLVNAMKEFSHPGTRDKILVDLNHAIENTIIVARNEWKYVADVDTELDPSLPLVPCLPGEMNQVILNLIINAAHAIADHVRSGHIPKGKIRVRTRQSPGYVEILVEDNGPGIPESIRNRVFDPFFTTKEIGKGTGQGLAIARSVIVTKHNGSIHFDTTPGNGTTFYIRIPHAAAASELQVTAA